MGLQELINLQKTCESHMNCETCPQKSKHCKDFKGILANIKEPWEIGRLIEDMGEYDEHEEED